MNVRWTLWTLLVFGAGCENQKIQLGAGPEADARFISDVYTWGCSQTDESGNVTTWQGAYSYNLSLEHAPDALTSLDLPSSGCNAQEDLFPDNAGEGGADIDGASPTWFNSDDYTGALSSKGDGFYSAVAFANRKTCGFVDDMLGDGTQLNNAGDFSGARAPTPGTLGDVTVSGGEVDQTSGIPFGADLTVSWDPTDWDESWVQIRREQGGSLVEAATCSTTGESSFQINDDVWSLMHEAVEVDVTNMFVAVQNKDTLKTENGEEIELITRVMYVAVIQD